MRLAFVVLSLALVACGGSSSKDDMSMSSTPDLTAPTPTTCYQIISCASSCGGAQTCEAACAAKGSPAAQMLYTTLYSCAYSQCLLAVADGGAGADGGNAAACMSQNDTSTACNACVISSAESTACTSQLNACING